MKVFISHTHANKPLADALRDLLGNLFSTNMEVVYSSDDSISFSSDHATPDRLEPGESWMDWIQDQVKTSDAAIVLLTPESVHKPWVMWESGAVAGVASAARKKSALIPITYRLHTEEIPAPLRQLQAASGEKKTDIEKVIATLNRHLKARERPQAHLFKPALEKYVPEYLTAVQNASAPDKPVIKGGFLESSYAIADMRIDLNHTHDMAQKAQNTVFTASSKAADQFFHVPEDHTLSGKSIYEAFTGLEVLCDPDQWKAVEEEQKSLRFDLLQGKPRPATKPLKFLEDPAAEEKGIAKQFRNRFFLPLIVQHTRTQTKDDDYMDLRLLYFRVPSTLTKQGKHWECDLDIPSLVHAVEEARQATEQTEESGPPPTPNF